MSEPPRLKKTAPVRFSARTLALCFAGLALGLAAPQASAAGPTGSSSVAQSGGGGVPAEGDVRQVADWVVQSADNGGRPFVIIDKVNARVFVFGDRGEFRGSSPALLGLTRGDDAVPGIGDQKLSNIRPDQRITPAGRFVAAIGRDFEGRDVVWIDYAGGIAMHRVITSNPAEHRLDRLATATTLDNRISFGCINLPVKFYESVVRPAFTGADGVVYILPEVKSLRQVFFEHDEARSRTVVTGAPAPRSGQ